MLLDSHVLLDIVEDAGRIGPVTRKRLAEEVSFVSAASLWELTIKSLSGRLVIRGDLSAGLDSAGLRRLPILAEHTVRIGEVTGLVHNDPFDRMLLTQAKVEGLEFCTWDRHLLGAGLPFVRDARD